MWMKERDAIIKKKEYFLPVSAKNSQEILRLKIKNLELIQKLKRLSEEVEQKVERMQIGTKRQERPETKEALLVNQIECAQSEEKVLLTEIADLKEKINKVNTHKVVDLEKELKEAKNRNAMTEKNLKKKARDVKELEKKYIKSQAELENAKTLQEEETRITRFINKELEKQAEIESKIMKDATSQNIKTDRISQICIEIQKEEHEISQLKNSVSPQNELENEKICDKDEYDYFDKSQLKMEYMKLKSGFDNEQKIFGQEKGKLEQEIEFAKSKLTDLLRQKTINGHKLQEVSRIIKAKNGQKLVNKSAMPKLLEKEQKRKELMDRLLKKKQYSNIKLRLKPNSIGGFLKPDASEPIFLLKKNFESISMTSKGQLKSNGETSYSKIDNGMQTIEN